ncbi:hypothetical protein I3843_11G078000 [Carya illinoinensis]|uniref:Uncharacterized protein n=1 Tax=Carya illinoinensis TaxID=32201 RepID=A0A922DNA6_CARIL|nr:hypothetical protein I3842_11G078300 [Carya illinoinensis]KAG7955546.1 hypothetical protein I3843_11G078000 [Carya illinoinensis]
MVPLLFPISYLQKIRCCFVMITQGIFNLRRPFYDVSKSGLKINLMKTEMVAVGDVRNIWGLANILGCGVSSLPMKYLGLPLGASFKAKTIWAEVVEKLDRRLAGWKRLYLFRGGGSLYLTFPLISCLYSPFQLALLLRLKNYNCGVV